MRKVILLIFLLFSFSVSNAQNGQRNVWMIADSLKIDFTNGLSVLQEGSNTGIENAASYNDANGNLIFYCGFEWQNNWNSLNIYNSNHSIIQNGTSYNVSSSYYQGGLFIPHPGDTNLVYFIFREYLATTAVSTRLKYCIINKTLNNGLGGVSQSAAVLSDSSGTEALAACKHANGRDWWLIQHNRNDPYQYIIKLLTPNGFSSDQFQNIGSINNIGINFFKFSRDGSKFIAGASNGALDVFDFDRCTGQLSNYIELGNATTSPFFGYFGIEISSNGRFIYSNKTSSKNDTIFQYDLFSSNPKMDKKVIFVAKDSLYSSFGHFALAHMLMGPDNKIYINRENLYTYPQSVQQARSLTVINSPDLKDSLCDIDPYSIPVPTRLRGGLPNLPFYELGRLIGSPCDTLTAGLDESNLAISPSIQAMYNSNSGSISLYAQGLRGKNINVMLYDLQGRLIKTAQGKTNGSSFAYTLKVNDLRNALYIIQLQSEKEVLSAKVMVE